MLQILSVLALVGAGVTAGVLFGVAISLVPGFLALPAGAYVEAHKLFGRYFDRVMPPTVLSTILLTVGLAIVSDAGAPRWLAIAAAVSLACVSVISQTRNVPLNRQVKRLDGSDLPVDWPDPRRTWRGWHTARTVAAVVALALLATSVALP